MNLIEEYLRAVALLLPKAQRDDIVAELRDVVLSRIEAREAELGRALTDDETEAVLRRIGHPLVVAAGYREGPRHVVGPALYPYWAFAVKASITIQAAVAVVVFVIRGLGGGNVIRAFDQALASAVTGSVTLIGVATVVVWLIERRAVKLSYLDRWRVRDLRALEFAAWDWESLRDRLAGVRAPMARGWSRGGRRAPGALASRGLWALASGAVLLLWWVGVLHFPIAANAAELRQAGVEPGALETFDWTGLRATVFWPVAAYCAAVMAQGALLLARPDAVRLHGLSDVAIGAGVLAFAAWIWTASPLASAVWVDSMARLSLRMRTAFEGGRPFALAPLLTIAAIATAFGAVCRIMRGLWELAVGATDGAAVGMREVAPAA